MNCKQGDLAVVIRSDHGHEGRVVRCIRLFPNYITQTEATPFAAWGCTGYRPLHYSEMEHSWCKKRGFDFVAADSQLRPLRDNDGQDETLTWAGKPEKVKA